MKAFVKFMSIALPVMSLAVLSSCTIGAATATAGYVSKTDSADSLPICSEQRTSDKLEGEMITDIADND
jgi:hypothetical protein